MSIPSNTMWKLEAAMDELLQEVRNINLKVKIKRSQAQQVTVAEIEALPVPEPVPTQTSSPQPSTSSSELSILEPQKSNVNRSGDSSSRCDGSLRPDTSKRYDDEEHGSARSAQRPLSWHMYLEDINYEFANFKEPLTVWTKKQKYLLKKEIRTICYENKRIKSNAVIHDMQQLIRAEDSSVQVKNLASELVSMSLQDLCHYREMPFRDVVYPLSEDIVYDWVRISAAVQGTHTSSQCWEYWNTKFHPSLNRKCWSKAENRAMLDLIEYHGLQHWKDIAGLMETNRTKLQCYVQFRRNFFEKYPAGRRRSQWKGFGQKKKAPVPTQTATDDKAASDTDANERVEQALNKFNV